MVSGELKFSSEITDHPVESGSNVADNIRRNATEFTLEAIVSDSPIGEIAEHESRRIDEVTEAVFGSDAVPLPSAEAYDRLLAIHNEKRLVTIEIPVASRNGKPAKRTFQNMGIQDITLPMNIGTSGGLFFSVSFKEVRVVTNRRTTIRTAVPRGAGKKPKVTVGTPLRADQFITWRKGIPPGAALKPGFATEEVSVVYAKQAGFTREESISNGDSIPSSTHVRYFGDGNRIILDVPPTFERSALIKDILRDRNEKRQQELVDLKKLSPAEQKRQAQNLPDGLDLSRFTKTPPGPTFPATGPSTTFPPGTVK